MPRLHRDIARAIQRLKNRRMSTRHVADLFSVSSATVSYWWRKPPLQKSSKTRVCPPKYRRNARAVDARRARIRTILRKEPLLSARDIRGRLRQMNVLVSKSTVLRDFKCLNLVSRVRPRVCCLAVDEKRRLEFAEAWLRHPQLAKRILWSDEKIFTSNDESLRRMWVPRGSHALVRRCTRWPTGRVMVWGCIGIGFRFLAVFPKAGADDAPFRLTAGAYVRRCLSPAFAALGARTGQAIFQQDGAPSHSAASTMRYLRGRGMRLLENYPPRSPDLSPIETLWALLARSVSSHQATSRDELVEAVRREWEAIPQATIDNLVRSFLSRCAHVQNLRGGM